MRIEGVRAGSAANDFQHSLLLTALAGEEGCAKVKNFRATENGGGSGRPHVMAEDGTPSSIFAVR